MKLVSISLGWAVIMAQFNLLSTYPKYGHLYIIILIIGSILAGTCAADLRLTGFCWLPSMVISTVITYFSYMAPVTLVVGTVIEELYVELQFIWAMQQLLIKTMAVGIVSLFSGILGGFIGEAYIEA